MRQELHDRLTGPTARFLLSDTFLTWHLIANYSLLATTLVLYLLGVGVWVIMAGSLPGAIIFLVTAALYAYRKGFDMLAPHLGVF